MVPGDWLEPSTGERGLANGAAVVAALVRGRRARTLARAPPRPTPLRLRLPVPCYQPRHEALDHLDRAADRRRPRRPHPRNGMGGRRAGNRLRARHRTLSRRQISARALKPAWGFAARTLPCSITKSVGT